MVLGVETADVAHRAGERPERPEIGRLTDVFGIPSRHRGVAARRGTAGNERGADDMCTAESFPVESVLARSARRSSPRQSTPRSDGADAFPRHLSTGHGGAVTAYASRITGDRGPAEDVTTSVIVREAVSRLSPDHRAALYECYFRGRTVGEAAAILGVPAGTVKTRLYYAMRHLRESTNLR
jgi:hypothetical protein